VDERLHQQRRDRVQLLAPHALDLLDDVRPVGRFVHWLARSEAAQQLGLALAPDQDVGIVEIVHHLLLNARRTIRCRRN
jgi:hypothetical protein